MESLLFLSTRQSENNLNYNPSWNLSSAEQFRSMDNFTLSLVSAQFANSVYPINSFNKYLYFTEVGPFDCIATMPHNNYTGTQLATELTTQMNAVTQAGAVYAVVYDSQTQKITITSTLNFIVTSGLYNMNEELGIEFFTYGTTTVGDNPIIISGTSYVDLVCNVSSRNYTTGGNKSVLDRIPIDVNFGEHVYYLAPDHAQLSIYQSDFQYIYCQLLDDRGNLWPLPANSHLSLCFKVTQ